MNRLSNVSKVIVVAVVAAILIVIAIVYGTSGGSRNPQETITSLTATSPAETVSSASGTTQADTKAPAANPSVPIVKSPAPPVIHIIIPVAGDVWKIGTQNTISWNKPGDISGSLSLIDATNQQFVGTILPEVGSNQISYTWNTLSVSLSRTNPLGKDIVPGTYEIQLDYDGNNIKPATSPAFTITN